MLSGRYLQFAAIGCLLGVYAAKYWPVSLSCAVLLVGILVIIGLKLPRLATLVFIGIGLVAGLARSVPVLDGYESLAKHENSKVQIQATITTDPVYHSSGQYEFNANDLRLADQAIDAEVRIRSHTNDVRRGDTILATGNLRDGFASWQASIYYADVSVISRDSSSLESFRSQFIANVYSALPDPEASLGLGFLVGIRSLLPEQLDDDLRTTGLTHIVAVSGYNLTILANASKRLLSRRSRFMAVSVTLALLLGFTSVTGMSPSILRATIVSVLSIVGWYYGRNKSPWALLLYSSALSAMLNPAYPWSSIGWYLSLAAFFGVLIIAPLIAGRLRDGRELGIVEQIFVETTSAQLLTLPVIMFVFGEVSVVALLANILVLPFIPLCMMAVFLVGMTFFASLYISGTLAAISYIILRYVTSIISLLANLGWALVEVPISLFQMLMLFAFIGLAYLSLRHQKNSI